jgi:hypothetical protein
MVAAPVTGTPAVAVGAGVAAGAQAPSRRATTRIAPSTIGYFIVLSPFKRTSYLNYTNHRHPPQWGIHLRHGGKPTSALIIFTESLSQV